MIKHRKLVAILVCLMFLFSTTAAFGAVENGSVYNLDGSLYATGYQMELSPSLQAPVYLKQSQYLYGYDGNYYSFTDVVSAFEDAEYDFDKFVESISALEPVTPEPDELEVVSVSAINANTIKVTFNQEVEGLAKADVVVTNVNTADKQYVKSVTLAEDKKSAEIVFYDNLVTKNTYKVVIGEAEKEFDFVIDAVAEIEAETLQVVEAGKSTAIEYKVYDANGLDVTANVKNDISFEATIYVDNEGKVNLTAGQQGFVYVVYKAGTDEEVKSARITVKAETPQAVKLLAYTVEESPDFTAEDFEAVTTVQKSDSTKTIKVYVEDQFGNKYSSTETDLPFEVAVAYESLNKEVALVDRATGKITPLKEGTADVRITIGEFSVVRPIEIVADAKIAALSLEKETIEVSDKIAQSVDVVVKDQYGNTFSPGSTEKMTATIKSGSNIITLDSNELPFDDSQFKQTFTITPVEGKEGTATIEFAVGEIKTTLTVVVKKADAIDDYVVEGFESKLDLYVNNKAETPQYMTLEVFGVDANGVKVGEALTYADNDNDSDYTVELKGKDADGKDIKTTNFVTVSATGAKIAPTTVGTYTVTIKVGTLTVYTNTFEVVDTAPQPTAEVIKANVTGSAGSNMLGILKDVIHVDTNGITGDVSIEEIEFLSDNSAVVESGTAAKDTEGATIATDATEGAFANLILKTAKVYIGETEYTVDLGNVVVKLTVVVEEAAGEGEGGAGEEG